jgi:hypothetical protein
MPADAFAVDVRGEYILDQLLGLMINEWLMTTVVLNTLKPRLTVVIRVRENFVYESFGYRSRRHPGCWCRRQASLVEMVNESVYIQTIVRDMKWQETRDRYRFVAAFDEADYLGISSTQAGPIETVGAFTMERLRVDDHFEDRFYSSEPMRRGSSYDLQFRRLPEPGAVDPYMLVGEWRRFHEPTRLATFDVAFLGKVPRLVWKFTGLAHLQSPGEPEPGQLLKLIKGQFVRARFPDLYGGLFSGVAWEW